MNLTSRRAPKVPFAQNVILTERHKAMLEELRYRNRLNFTEAIRLGIEQIWKQHTQGESTSGVHLEA